MSAPSNPELASRSCSSRFAADALAHVERQHDVERNLLEADEVDLLRHAIVQHFEVGRLEADDRFVAIGDEDVHAYGLDLRREHDTLRLERDSGRSQE